MHMRTVWSSNFLMESFVGFSCPYSHMLLITRKSKLAALLLAYSDGNCRILLACMKLLGNCPCPDCLVTKDKICKLGTKIDQWVRDKKAHVDDGARCWLIKGARKAMFDLGHSIASKAVEGTIRAKSLMPTWVRVTFICSTSL